MGMGGFGSLGDRVAKATVVAQISDNTEIIDPEDLNMEALVRAVVAAHCRQRVRCEENRPS
jgi:hypothetical protein